MTVESDDGRVFDEDDDEVVHDEPLFERRMNVLSLCNGGMTYRQIAEHFSISEFTARADYKWALKYVGAQDAETIIKVHRSVILDGRRANYKAYLSGDKDAAMTILKGLDYEAKLLGLYAPVRVTTGPNHIEFKEQAAEIISALAPTTLKELLRGTHLDPNAHPAERPDVLDVDTVDESVDPGAGDVAPAGPWAGAGDVGPIDPAPGPAGESVAQPAADEPEDDGWSNV